MYIKINLFEFSWLLDCFEDVDFTCSEKEGRRYLMEYFGQASGTATGSGSTSTVTAGRDVKPALGSLVTPMSGKTLRLFVYYSHLYRVIA